MRATILGVIGLVCVATMAQGQLTGLNHLWTVPGVMTTSGGISTFIACTNANTSSETVGVDIYGSSGSYITPANPNSITMSPGSTVIFGTSLAGSLSVDINYGTSTLTKGYAEVLSSATKGILCSAFLADAASVPIPTSFASLTVAKKTKQKGD